MWGKEGVIGVIGTRGVNKGKTAQEYIVQQKGIDKNCLEASKKV